MTADPTTSATFPIGQIGLSYGATVNKLWNLSGLVSRSLFLKSLSNAAEVAFLHLVMLPSSTHGLPGCLVGDYALYFYEIGMKVVYCFSTCHWPKPSHLYLA